MSQQNYHFEFLPLEGQVDKDKGVIRDVSVITAGVAARGHKTKEGHSLHTDMTTLKEMKAVGNKMIKVPVKWNHRTGADAVNGYLFDFRIRGQKLIADWSLLKKHERYEQALELVETMPEGVGLSASFRGESKVVGKKAFARCSELPSVDLVATPAANPDGMFSDDQQGGYEPQVDTSGRDMSDNNNAPGAGEEEVNLGDVMDYLKGIGQRLESVEEFHSQVSDAVEAEEQEFAEGQEAEAVELEQGEDPINYLERRLAEEHQLRADEAAQIEFDEHNDKVAQLIAANQQLSAENSAMAATIHEFSDGQAAFSTNPTDGAVSVTMPQANEAGGALTDFEARVQELQTGDNAKDATDAITFAIEENEGRYNDHLEELGALG
jgi:hypothetical protein